jgi:hypothetical protein
MENRMIKFEDAEAIANNFVIQHPDQVGARYKEIELEKLVPNRSVDSPDYWEFWLIQEDARLVDVDFTKSLGVELGKVLTYVGQPPSILISKLRVAKSSGELEIINMT